MVEAVWSETPRPSLTLSPPPQTTSQPTPQYLQINYGNTGSISRRESLLSPSAGRRAKQQRYIAGKLAFSSCFSNEIYIKRNGKEEDIKYLRNIFHRLVTIWS